MMLRIIFIFTVLFLFSANIFAQNEEVKNLTVLKRSLHESEQKVVAEVLYQVNYNGEFIIGDEKEKDVIAVIPVELWENLGYKLPVFNKKFIMKGKLVKKSISVITLQVEELIPY